MAVKKSSVHHILIWKDLQSILSSEKKFKGNNSEDSFILEERKEGREEKALLESPRNSK